jgi:GNAT superfamily N-acetyltransferase
MLRPAAMGDLPALYAITEEMHVRSRYAERGVELSPNLVKSRLLEGIRRNGGEHSGCTLLNVIDKDGVKAFMMGLLQPVYGIGVGLEAQDVMLCAAEKAPKISAALLVNAYVEWALHNPRVKDIYLSWTDIAGVDGKRLSKLYQRRGFQRCGEIWKRGV